jgi:hypothetical protein
VHNADKKAQATIRRYTPSIESLARFSNGRDIRLLTPSDIWAWAEQRRDTGRISPTTVNRNDLVAAACLGRCCYRMDIKTTRLPMNGYGKILNVRNMGFWPPYRRGQVDAA